MGKKAVDFDRPVCYINNELLRLILTIWVRPGWEGDGNGYGLCFRAFLARFFIERSDKVGEQDLGYKHYY